MQCNNNSMTDMDQPNRYMCDYARGKQLKKKRKNKQYKNLFSISHKK